MKKQLIYTKMSFFKMAFFVSVNYQSISSSILTEFVFRVDLKNYIFKLEHVSR